MPIFKFDKKKKTHCIGGSMSYILLWKHHQTLKICWALMASIVTFLMTTYKFVFLDNFVYDFFPCNCRSSDEALVNFEPKSHRRCQSYGSYNYLCIQCLSPLKLSVHGEVYSMEQCVIKLASDLPHLSFGYSGVLHQYFRLILTELRQLQGKKS
jgi:hypothetical protein